MKKPSCRNPTCSLPGNVASRRIIRYGFYRNHGRETAPLPMRRLRTDVLVDKRHALLPAPAPPNDIRHGRHTPRRGGQPVGDRPNRTTGLEHRRPLARAGPLRCVVDLTRGGPPASSLQNCKPTKSARSRGGRPGRRGYSQRLRSGRVSGRRPSSDDAATETPSHSFTTWRRG